VGEKRGTEFNTGADPASKLGGGDFSDIWWSRLITNSLL